MAKAPEPQIVGYSHSFVLRAEQIFAEASVLRIVDGLWGLAFGARSEQVIKSMHVVRLLVLHSISLVNVPKQVEIPQI